MRLSKLVSQSEFSRNTSIVFTLFAQAVPILASLLLSKVSTLSELGFIVTPSVSAGCYNIALALPEDTKGQATLFLNMCIAFFISIFINA